MFWTFFTIQNYHPELKITVIMNYGCSLPTNLVGSVSVNNLVFTMLTMWLFLTGNLCVNINVMVLLPILLVQKTEA